MMLAKLCVLASVLYLVKVFLYPFFRPVSRKQKKLSRMYSKEKKREEAKMKWTRMKRYIAEQYVKNLLSSSDRLRFKKIIDRLDLTIKPEELRVEQLMYAGAAVILTIVLGSANVLLGCIAAVFIVLGWLYPIDEMEKKIERKNKSIALDFPSFYSMVYYQYSRSVNIYLKDVVRDYIPNANPDMAEELGVMLDNMEYGEEYALKQLKKRVPIHYIIKFCDMMETRLKGYDNVSQMGYLKNELDQFRIHSLEEELHRRERSNARLQLLLIIILAVYIIIYYTFTIMDALQLFQ